ncbi:shikimate kinase [Chitinophaga terrae (ex Kim and Jung 2007)]|uniref:Shikimate kinase n=1 Tax=Chitinophaga terrae (ex Kim and Jung 2007) TaxID=408074 RepID=A0A1H3X2L9_9BACT|nr:shikimate kinase [Chitinophaga terrae (ex Kim and Jung 2007)]MDQ0106951.1 shikimate kinase [Chitinophaga terrae (ex Kim and Jung 2007)]SDZ92874.1 shikimate kinase [Chitinophaga terrae (ex Kim and Jung 2007)]
MKIYLLGFMGAGKSYWGKQLADHWGLPFYDLDDVIVETEEMAIADIFATKGEDYFREKESLLLRELSKQDNFLISCGGGTPCFQENMDFMNSNGTTIWINPSLETMADRLKRKKQKRPLIADLEDEDLEGFIEKKLAERLPFYQQSRHIITSDNITLDTFTEKLGHA